MKKYIKSKTEYDKLYSVVDNTKKMNREIFYIDNDGVFHWGKDVRKKEDTKLFADMVNDMMNGEKQ